MDMEQVCLIKEPIEQVHEVVFFVALTLDFLFGLALYNINIIFSLEKKKIHVNRLRSISSIVCLVQASLHLNFYVQLAQKLILIALTYMILNTCQL